MQKIYIHMKINELRVILLNKYVKIHDFITMNH